MENLCSCSKDPGYIKTFEFHSQDEKDDVSVFFHYYFHLMIFVENA